MAKHAELRQAAHADMAHLFPLMNRAIRQLLAPWLNPQQIDGSFEFMGLDSQLIADGTYFVVLIDGSIAGCGGWSRRATLFGGDHSDGRSPRLLDPETEPARVRAMYTDPAYTRRGIGRRILERCENAARSEGFTHAELAATAAGLPLYEACGYAAIEDIPTIASNGASIPLIRMGKILI